MKITRLVHACLLVETSDKVVLVDPGVFSTGSGMLQLDAMHALDYLVITHEHADHFDQAFVGELLKKFPEVVCVSTPEVTSILGQMEAQHSTNEPIGMIDVISTAKHADLSPIGVAPNNISVTIDGKLTVGGDRHDLEKTSDVLALTVTAPWGSMMSAAAMADKLQPKVIVPVHDWHWNEQARSGAYDTLQSHFAERGIQFIKAVDGESFEV